MTMKIDCSSQFAETNDEIFFPDNDAGKTEFSVAGCRRDDAGDASTTRKVWHAYLAQHDVTAAILTVMLPSAGSQRHAFLVGLDHVRHDPRATQQLLAIAERLWLRTGQQSTFQFDVSGIEAADGLAGLASEALAIFEHGVVAQTQHNGAIVRAVYFREKGLDRFNPQEVGSLRLILPLFAESAAGGAQLARQSERSAMLEAMFDRVSLAMTMLSADAKPLFMNSAATAMLDERKWLIRSADGSIASADAKQSKQFRESIRLAATADTNIPTETVFRLDCNNGDWRLAYVLSAISRSGDTTTRCAMLIVLAPGKMDAPTQLLEALGLLPSEQRFLGHFLKSSSLGNAAVDCGLSEETARTYLKRVRAKLGVHRQMELAGLISGLVLPVHAGSSQSAGE
jgi:DNA-directed RNA polymerase specialized sigma24 family protein